GGEQHKRAAAGSLHRPERGDRDVVDEAPVKSRSSAEADDGNEQRDTTARDHRSTQVGRRLEVTHADEFRQKSQAATKLGMDGMQQALLDLIGPDSNRRAQPWRKPSPHA